MIIRVHFPPRGLAQVESNWMLDEASPEDGSGPAWNGETIGCAAEFDGARLSTKLRFHLNGERRGGRTNSSSFKNKVALASWLQEKLDEGRGVVELADSPCVDPYENYLHDLVVWDSSSLTHKRWADVLVSVTCADCGKSYPANDLTEIEYDLFWGGEYVLTCPHHHHLFVLGTIGYLLGG